MREKAPCQRFRSHAWAVLWPLLLGASLTACATPERAQREVSQVWHSDAKQWVDENPRVILIGGDGLFSPQFECMDLGCPATVLCGRAVCSVIHCGKGSCTYCPEPMPDVFKNLVLKSWCSYGCMAGSQRTGAAYGFIPAIGGKFVGPWCIDTDLPELHTAGVAP